MDPVKLSRKAWVEIHHGKNHKTRQDLENKNGFPKHDKVLQEGLRTSSQSLQEST